MRLARYADDEDYAEVKWQRLDATTGNGRDAVCYTHTGSLRRCLPGAAKFLLRPLERGDAGFWEMQGESGEPAGQAFDAHMAMVQFHNRFHDRKA